MMDYRGHFGTTVVNNKVMSSSQMLVSLLCLGTILTRSHPELMHWPFACALDRGLSPVRIGHSLMRLSTYTGVWLLTCRDVRYGSGFRVQGSGFRVHGSGFRVQGSGFRVHGSWFRVQGSGFRDACHGMCLRVGMCII